jgi:tetratricopeptide (TPR) repeat protein
MDHAMKRANPKNNPNSGTNMDATASGQRSVAVAGNVAGSIITGDGNLSFGVVSTKVINSVLEATHPQRLNQLPEPVADFKGRTEVLDELKRAIRNGCRICCLSGIGGLGKTEIALKLAHALKDDYPAAQIYLDLRGNEDVPKSYLSTMEHVVQSHRPAIVLPKHPDALAGLYRSVLKDKRAILFLDNVANPEQIRPLIPPSSCLLLLTSIRKFVLPGMHQIEVPPMERAEAAEFLSSLAPRAYAYCGEIARLCGYLPLALRLAGSYLETQRHVDPSNYVSNLRDNNERLKYLSEVEVSIDLSYRQLRANDQSLFTKLAVFPGSFDMTAVAAVWGLNYRAAEETMGHLLNLSLVAWSVDTNRGSIHDLVRCFGAKYLKRASPVYRRHAQFYSSIVRDADKRYGEGGEGVLSGLNLFDLERLNIDTAWSWIRGQAGRKDGDVLHLQYCESTVYIGNLRYDKRKERIPQLEEALEAASRVGNKEQFCRVTTTLGLAYVDLGEDIKATKYYFESLQLAQEAGYEWQEARALGVLGMTMIALGCLDDAAAFLSAQEAYAQKLNSPRMTCYAFNGLGLTHLLQGHVDEALIQFQKQLSTAVRFDVGYRRGEGYAFGGLALERWSVGDLDEAWDMFQKQYDIMREIGDRKGMMDCSWNMGLVQELRGKAQNARPLLHSCLEYEQAIGHSYFASDQAIIALLCKSTGAEDRINILRNGAIRNEHRCLAIGAPWKLPRRA